MGSPCFTPIYELMKFEVADLYRTNDLTAEYTDLMAWMNLVLMLSAKSFCHRYILSILSNIFFPSQEKQHKVFFLFAKVLDIKACSIKIESIVDFPFWKPN